MPGVHKSDHVRMSLWLNGRLAQRLNAQSARTGQSRTDIIEKALGQYLDEAEKEPD